MSGQVPTPEARERQIERAEINRHSKAATRRSWIGGVVLLLLAAGVAAVIPSHAATEAPFRTELVADERVETRTIAATLLDVRLADVAESDGWSAPGTWLVIDVEIEATSEEESLYYVHLERSNGTKFRASERPDSLLDERLSPGLPLRGSVAFELPEHMRGESVRIDFGTMLVDPRADGLLSLEVDLSSLEPLAVAELLRTEPGTQGDE